MMIKTTNLSKRFRVKITSLFRFNAWSHSFNFIGADGAISLNISGPHVYGGQDNWSAGLEEHRRAPNEHRRADPPSHDECHVLKCPCWHDGSSLYG